MAPVPLNISPAFRPWRQAGITHLLLDDEVRERLLARQDPSRPKPRLPSGSTARRHSAGNAASLSRLPIPLPTAAARFQRPAKACTDRGHGHSGPGCLAAYWQTLLKKTPPRPSLVWSYPSLSRDLGGATPTPRTATSCAGCSGIWRSPRGAMRSGL